MSQSQNLLKRHPDLTPSQFSERWQRHGLLVAPWALKYGITYYAQVCRCACFQVAIPTTLCARATSPVVGTHHSFLIQIHDIHLQSTSAEIDFDINEWDGASEMIFTASAETRAEWSENDPCYLGYYENVILPDERQFLVSEAMSHVKRVDPDTVCGQKVVLIENGKAVVDIPDDVLQVWRQWDIPAHKVQLFD
jgi:hypothetical protein